MTDLSGKIVLISGTGGGQGRAAALRFARDGATVFGCDLNLQGHLETQQLLQAEGLEMHGDSAVDLGDPQQCQHWIAAAVAQFGRIDVLYNNASATRFGRVETFTLEDWRYVMRNELDLVFYATKYAWPHLTKPGATIINIASVAAWCGSTSTGKAAHSAAKAAVVAFTRQLAAEGASEGIRAVSISPGFIKTPGTAPFLDDPRARETLLSGILAQRPGEAEEVAALAAFVASNEATYINGSDLVIDGGLLAT